MALENSSESESYFFGGSLSDSLLELKLFFLAFPTLALTFFFTTFSTSDSSEEELLVISSYPSGLMIFLFFFKDFFFSSTFFFDFSIFFGFLISSDLSDSLLEDSSC